MRNWKDKGKNNFNFSCPICGDSQKNQRKARGYFFPKKNNLFYKCHNCGIGLSLKNFLKKVSPPLFQEYVLENFGEGSSTQNPSTPKIDNTLKQYFEDNVKSNFDEYIGLPNINQLKTENMAHEVCVARQIPEKYWDKLFFAHDWKEWVNEKIPDKYDFISEPRLVIPFYDRSGKMFMAQGRSLFKSKMKYLTVRLDEDAPKSPGMLSRHYSPDAKLRLNASVRSKPDEAYLGFGPSSVDATMNLSEAANLTEAAANLYAMLRTLDESYSAIAVAPIPDTGLGEAINDRLRRAALQD